MYEVQDDELYRARPGELCVHQSHPGMPIHAETNPCPDGRVLYVLDWTDRRQIKYKPNDGTNAGGAGVALCSLHTGHELRVLRGGWRLGSPVVATAPALSLECGGVSRLWAADAGGRLVSWTGS